MLSQKELGSLATVYFSNLPLASHYGFDNFDLLVQMVELMKRIGEIQEDLSSRYDTQVHFETPDSYHRAYAFLDESKEKFHKQVSLFIKDEYATTDNEIIECIVKFIKGRYAYTIGCSVHSALERVSERYEDSIGIYVPEHILNKRVWELMQSV